MGKKITTEAKQIELNKYFQLVIATLNYQIERLQKYHYTSESVERLYRLKVLTEEHYLKARLSLLKQWFRDLSQEMLETRDLNFHKYLQENTSYKINIFENYFKRIDKIIANGKINTDRQFADVMIMIDELSHAKPIDEAKIELLNNLIGKHLQKKELKKDIGSI